MESDPIGVAGLAMLGNEVPGIAQFSQTWFAAHPSSGGPTGDFNVDLPEDQLPSISWQQPFALGLGLYAYVDSNPLGFLDAFGLTKADKWWGYGNDKGFRDWWHKEKQYYGVEDIPPNSAPRLNESIVERVFELPSMRCALLSARA